MSGSKSRLRDSNKTLEGVNLNSATVIPRREVVPWPAPSVKRFCFLIVGRMEIAIPIACVLLIVYGDYLCISPYF